MSERDQNFRVAGDDGRGWVLKVSNSGEREAVIEMEVGVVRHIAAVDPTLPVALPHATRDGAPWAAAAGPGGTRHLVRLLPLMPGRNGAAAELSRDAIRDFGAVSARLGRATRGYFHRMAGRPILWDVKHCPRCGRTFPSSPDDRRGRSWRRSSTASKRRPAAPGRLPGAGDPQRPDLRQHALDADGRVSGIVDFGDMAHTALVLDLVAALVALFGGRQDPADLFGVAEAALAGYAAVTPLEDAEAAVLGDVVLARLAQTTLISAWRVGIYPENAAYLSSWDAEAWPMLALFEAVGLEEVRRRFTAAARESGVAVPAVGGEGTAGCGRPAPGRRESWGRRCRALTRSGPPRRRRWGRMYDPAGRAFRRLQQRAGRGHATRVVARDRRRRHPTRTRVPSGTCRLAERPWRHAAGPGHGHVRQSAARERPRLALGHDGDGGRGGNRHHGPTRRLGGDRRPPRGLARAGGGPRRDDAAADTDRLSADDGETWPERAAARVDAATAELAGRACGGGHAPRRRFTRTGSSPARPSARPVSAPRGGALFVADEVRGHGRMGDGVELRGVRIVRTSCPSAKPMGNGTGRGGGHRCAIVDASRQRRSSSAPSAATLWPARRRWPSST